MGMWDRTRPQRLLLEHEEPREAPDEQEPVLRSFLGSPERFHAFLSPRDDEPKRSS